jgi:hypothetical protein
MSRTISVDSPAAVGGHVKVEDVDGIAHVSINDEVTNIAGKGSVKSDSADGDGES